MPVGIESAKVILRNDNYQKLRAVRCYTVERLWYNALGVYGARHESRPRTLPTTIRVVRTYTQCT